MRLSLYLDDFEENEIRFMSEIIDIIERYNSETYDYQAISPLAVAGMLKIIENDLLSSMRKLEKQ